MPTFVAHVPIYFNELLEDSAVATSALRSEASRVVVVTVDVAFVFIVRVLRAKEGRAYGACEVVYMELLVWMGRNVTGQ